MRSQLVFIVLIAVIFSSNCAKSAAESSNTANNQTPLATKTIGRMMVCNLIQDSHVSEAIKTLETKLKNLITLVNKTSPPQPTPPGIYKDRLGWDRKRVFVMYEFYQFMSNWFYILYSLPRLFL